MHYPTAPRRRGMTSILAMLYLVIFSALALGFYAATTTSSQVASNEKSSLQARLSAESGFQFLRYHLNGLDINANLTSERIFEEAGMQLSERLNGTPNLGGTEVFYDHNVIRIPAKGYIKLDPQGRQQFRAEITPAGDMLVANIIGRSDRVKIGHGIEIKFQKANRATEIFNYGVASRARIETRGTSTVTGLVDPKLGSILSTTTDSNAVAIFGKKVSGDISVVNASATVTWGSGVSIGGETHSTLIKQHIHYGVDEPRFPDIDTTVYSGYATNTYVPGMRELINCRVPAGVTCVLGGGDSIKGVLYLEPGAKLATSGSVTIQGVIATNTVPVADVATNTITFGGSVSALPIGDLPDADPFREVRKLQGAFIIAPYYSVNITGSVGMVNGSIICGSFSMTGNAESTIKGSIIQMDDRYPTIIEGSADVTIASVGTTEYPVGVTFGLQYTPVPGSYLEKPVGRETN